MKDKKRARFEYKWVIVGISALMIFISLGFASGTRSLYLDVVTDFWGFERSLFSLSDSFRFAASAIGNLLFGRLVMRFGRKPLILCGLGLQMLSMLLFSFAEVLPLFYLAGFVLGLGFSFTSTTMVGSIINRWWGGRNGTVMGFVLASNGIGAAVAIQILTPIVEAGGDSYRNAYRLTALFLLIAFVVMAIFMKEKPADGVTEISDSKAPDAELQRGLRYEDVIHTPVFWGLLVCVFIIGFCLQGILGATKAHLRDVGIDAEYVGLCLSVHAVTLTVFKFLTGVCYDRFGLRVTATICTTTGAVVMLLLVFASPSPAGKAIAMIQCAFSSMAIPLETIMLNIFTRDLFGRRAFDRLIGIVVASSTLGYAVGMPLVNLVYDILGSYNMAHIICSSLMVVVTVVMQFIITAAHKKKRLAEEADATVAEVAAEG